MPRETMAALITRTRLLIGDTAGASAVFTDDQVQTALDAHRHEYRYLELDTLESIAPGGATTYQIFYAPVGDWEDDVELVDTGWNVLAAETEDLQAGRWEFSVEPSWPVRLNGKSYDLYGAAADLLDEWAAKLKLQYTFSPGVGNYTRSQKFQQTAALAQQYRAKQRPRVVPQIRSDLRC